MVGDDEEGLLGLVGLRYVTGVVASLDRETHGTTGVEVAAAGRRGIETRTAWTTENGLATPR